MGITERSKFIFTLAKKDLKHFRFLPFIQRDFRRRLKVAANKKRGENNSWETGKKALKKVLTLEKMSVDA